MKDAAVSPQYAALPWLRAQGFEILLITSRETRRMFRNPELAARLPSWKPLFPRPCRLSFPAGKALEQLLRGFFDGGQSANHRWPGVQYG